MALYTIVVPTSDSVISDTVSVDDDDSFKTPPSSRYQSSASLVGSTKSVYLSALELGDGMDTSQTSKGENEVCLADETKHDDREDETDDLSLVTDTSPLTQKQVTRDSHGGDLKTRTADPGTCHCLMCDIHRKSRKVVNTKWKYLICALKCSDLNCPNYNELSKEDLLKWLDNLKAKMEISTFVRKCFSNEKPTTNAIQREQSQTFFFFFLLLHDLMKLSDAKCNPKHEQYPHRESFLTWVDECVFIINILLQASYTHIDSSRADFDQISVPFTVIKRIKQSHESKDYIGISFEDSGLDPAVDETKRLQRKLAGTPSTLKKIFAIAAIVMFITDIGTDVFQVVTYRREGNPLWPLIFIFIIGPSILSTVLCFYQICKENTETKKDKALKRLGIVLVSLQLGQVWRNICEIVDRYPIVDSYIVLSLLIIKMIEGLLEGGPQSLIQMYVLLQADATPLTFQNIIKYVSPLVSSFSMAAALTDLDLGRAGYCIPIRARLLSIVCRLGEVWGRFVAYAVCISAFGFYGFFLFGVQFLVITIPTFLALRKDHNDNRSQHVNCVYLRCRYGGFYQEKPRNLFTGRIPRFIVWFCVTSVYSFVPIQRFELDMEFTLRQTSRLPFWKCSRSYGFYNSIYALHYTFNLVAFTLWVTIGHGSTHRLFIPICVIFILGVVISAVFRLQSWVGRTYNIVLRPGFEIYGDRS